MPKQPAQMRAELALLAPTAAGPRAGGRNWTCGGTQIENVPRHIHDLSSFLIRTYLQARAAQR